MGAAAAYAFSRFRFRGRHGSLTALLIVQMFPQMLAFVAIFLVLLSIGDVFPALGLNSRLGLICVYLGGALGVNTFLMYGFFNTVPRELDEAAKIDGASHAQIFWTIILRLVAPILAVVGLLSFIGDVRRVPHRQGRPAAAGEVHARASGCTPGRPTSGRARWGLFAAGAVLAAIPVVAAVPRTCRSTSSAGLTAGSVKG